MAEYKCFFCNKNITTENLKRRVRCIYCGSKMIYKARSREAVVKAR